MFKVVYIYTMFAAVTLTRGFTSQVLWCGQVRTIRTRSSTRSASVCWPKKLSRLSTSRKVSWGVCNNHKNADFGHRIDDEQDEFSETYHHGDVVVSSKTTSSTSASSLEGLVPGANEGFFVVKVYKTDPSSDFDLKEIETMVEANERDRLELSPKNITVPLALMLLDPDEYPSRSRARKACRKANIMIHRGPLRTDGSGNDEKTVFDSEKCLRARVGDRVFPGDVLAKQVRMGMGGFPVLNHKKPPFDLPVIYEDDHFAIVNKPAGVVVYAQRKGGHGVMTVRAALPFAVQPSKVGTYSTLRRPQPVHRLDKPTSGLLVIAKTKPAMVHLSHQFRDRKVKKTYMAIVNGIPQEPVETTISSKEAYGMGVDVDPDGTQSWQLIDHPLDEKSAVTIWRSVKYTKSLVAEDNYVTLIELKPKTGRYHQLRRHMAWVCQRPLVGDTEYDGGGTTAMQLRGRGLFLCSNRVTLEHPFYTSIEEEADRKNRDMLWTAPDGKVMVTASIGLPEKFESFMMHEEERYEKLAAE
mmetsp:Transcript_9154/g.16385  ORF Transcript_9154/g.16385 Transcript_9154/m.16385 type:complete len:525 (-) Transcript_9154:41-1615(-)